MKQRLESILTSPPALWCWLVLAILGIVASLHYLTLLYLLQRVYVVSGALWRAAVLLSALVYFAYAIPRLIHEIARSRAMRPSAQS